MGAAASGAGLGRRFGRLVLQVGAITMAAGIAAIMAAAAATGGAVTGRQLAPGLLVCGIGMGLLITLFFDIVLAGVSLPMVGCASGVLNATQQLGGAAGVAVLGTVFFDLFEGGDAVGAFQCVLATTACLSLATAALAFLLPRFARAEG